MDSHSSEKHTHTHTHTHTHLIGDSERSRPAFWCWIPQIIANISVCLRMETLQRSTCVHPHQSPVLALHPSEPSHWTSALSLSLSLSLSLRHASDSTLLMTNRTPNVLDFKGATHEEHKIGDGPKDLFKDWGELRCHADDRVSLWAWKLLADVMTQAADSVSYNINVRHTLDSVFPGFADGRD